MKVKLVPAVLFIIAVFLVGLLFLEGRKAPRKVLLIPAAIMLLLLLLLFKLIGKIALLIGIISAAIFLILLKKR